MTTATVHDTARQQIERAASQPTALYAQPAIVAAAALLEAWLVAADRRSVLAAAYRAELAARLAGAALDAVTAAYRASIPNEAGAIVLLNAAAAILRARGIQTARDGSRSRCPTPPPRRRGGRPAPPGC